MPPGAARRWSAGRSTAIVVAFVFGFAVVHGVLVTGVRAADPSLPARPTCEELYPDPGPAGLDLRLGCIVPEITGHYTGADPASAPRITGWLLPMGLALVALVLFAFSLRLIARRAGATLAPTTPASWWRCPTCRSLNQAGRLACYRCRRPWGPDAADVPTDAHAKMRQSFGSPTSFEDPREWRDQPPAGGG